MVGAIAVQLENLIAVKHDREISALAVACHLEHRLQKRTFHQHIAHQQVQPQAAQTGAEGFGRYRLIIHPPTLAGHGGWGKRFVGGLLLGRHGPPGRRFGVFMTLVLEGLRYGKNCEQSLA